MRRPILKLDRSLWWPSCKLNVARHRESTLDTQKRARKDRIITRRGKRWSGCRQSEHRRVYLYEQKSEPHVEAQRRRHDFDGPFHRRHLDVLHEESAIWFDANSGEYREHRLRPSWQNGAVSQRKGTVVRPNLQWGTFGAEWQDIRTQGQDHRLLHRFIEIGKNQVYQTSGHANSG